MRALSLLLSVFVLSVHAFGGELTLAQLRAKLSSRGANWVAGETSVSRLSREEIKRMLGAPRPDSNYFINRTPSKLRLPSEFDWGNVNGTSFLSPILDQGRCGSCVAFATIGTLDTQMNITRNTPYSPWAFSAQSLFSCGGGSCESGWMPDDAVSFLKSTGVPDEACFPYQSGALGQDVACSAGCSTSAQRSEKIVGSTTPTMFFKSNDSIKQALQKGPLITTLTVYEDFLYYTGGVYSHTTGSVAGGHAVSIVGWNDREQAWIVRNSWGPDWGMKGYVHVAWDDDSGLGNSTWGIQVSSGNGMITFDGVEDHDVWFGTTSFVVNSTFPGTNRIEWALSKGSSPIAGGVLGASGRVSVNTGAIADGVYSLSATVSYSGGTATSQTREVYVVNTSNPSGSLVFTNIKDGDTLTTTKALEMSVQSSPVPFTRVVFRAKNTATGSVTQRGTTNVASKMAINWRIQNLPRGNYELTLEGDVGSSAITSTPITVTLGSR